MLHFCWRSFLLSVNKQYLGPLRIDKSHYIFLLPTWVSIRMHCKGNSRKYIVCFMPYHALNAYHSGMYATAWLPVLVPILTYKYSNQTKDEPFIIFMSQLLIMGTSDSQKILNLLQIAFLMTWTQNAFALARTILHALLSQRPIYMCQTKLFAR